MQFQVPQFIESEDKIIGPLTIRQFIYVVIAGGFCFALYFTVKTWVFVFLSAIFMGAALALGMVKISGRPLTHIVRAAFSFYWKPQLYLWQSKHSELPRHQATLESLSVLGGQAPLRQGYGGQAGSPAAGGALRGAWQKLQTGSKMSNQQFLDKTDERYQIYQKLTGDRHAAKRIDYR